MPQTPAQKRQFYAIKNQLTAAERDLIKYYETEWFLAKRVPTVEQVVKYLQRKRPKVTHISVNYYLTRWPVKKALKDRGIPWEQHSQSELTQEQVAAAIVVMNFADTRSIKDKLSQLGVNINQYYAWLNDPQFKNLVNSLADQNLENIRPAAIAEFTKKINAGDWQAIKYFLDNTGAIQNEAPQGEALMGALIEILQRHVKDPATLMAIANDIKAVTQNRTIEPEVLEITDYSVVDDNELQAAKKALGI